MSPTARCEPINVTACHATPRQVVQTKSYALFSASQQDGTARIPTSWTSTFSGLRSLSSRAEGQVHDDVKRRKNGRKEGAGGGGSENKEQISKAAAVRDQTTVSVSKVSLEELVGAVVQNVSILCPYKWCAPTITEPGNDTVVVSKVWV